MFTNGLDEQTTKLSLPVFSSCTELALLYVPLQPHLFALHLLLSFTQTGLSLFLPLPRFSGRDLFGRLGPGRFGLSAERLDVTLKQFRTQRGRTDGVVPRIGRHPPLDLQMTKTTIMSEKPPTRRPGNATKTEPETHLHPVRIRLDLIMLLEQLDEILLRPLRIGPFPLPQLAQMIPKDLFSLLVVLAKVKEPPIFPPRSAEILPDRPGALDFGSEEGLVFPLRVLLSRGLSRGGARAAASTGGLGLAQPTITSYLAAIVFVDLLTELFRGQEDVPRVVDEERERGFPRCERGDVFFVQQGLRG